MGDLAGPCFFAVLMGCARVVYAKVGHKLNLLNAQWMCGLLCVAAYLLAALSPVPVLALLGCGLCGFSVGICGQGLSVWRPVTCPRAARLCLRCWHCLAT